MSLQDLQDGLQIWVKLERRQGDSEIKERDTGNVRVVHVNAFPETPANATRADVHFVNVAPTEGFPEKDVLIKTVQGALGEGVFTAMTAEDLAGGPSYITLGHWLGSQDLALMLIGAVELSEISSAITPGMLGITGDQADEMAGNGFVMLGPADWTV